MRASAFVALGVAAGLTAAGGAERPGKLGEKYAAPAEVGRELVGTKALAWTARTWLNSGPLSLEKLRGKVVLVRWWTAPGCPYCSASADALNGWARKYRDRGLVVIGMYHHKERTPLTPEHVETHARKLGFEFPIAIDEDWKTLNRWWLDKASRGWTSVTFLVDRKGVIRHVHPGGAYFDGEPGFTALERAIESALAE